MNSHELRLRVAARTVEAEAITTFELVPEPGGFLPPFEPGAHLEVSVPGGYRRSYSLCNDPAERDRYLVAVHKETAGRGGSKSMHERVRVGDVLRSSPPRNTFPLEPAERYLLVAGGIGITPLLAMAYVLERRGAGFELHYCARSPDRMAFRELLRRAPFAERTKLHFDGGDPSRGLDVRALLAHRPDGARLYCCGPEGLMAAVRSASRVAWPSDTVHFESFTAEGTGAGCDNTDFEVTLQSTNEVLHVPADKSLLQVLREKNVFVPTDCEAGTCGTCLTGIIEGEVEHRDQFLSEPEKRAHVSMCVCVSRARSRKLKLDL